MKLQGKVAIVTGGGRDIGRACAMRLAEEGCAVAINYHSSSEGADSAVTEIAQAGGRAFAMKGDMTRREDVQALVEKAVAEWGKVDIAVPNAGGIIRRVPFMDLTGEFIDDMMALNFKSAIYLAQACVPHMGPGSSIVMMASQAARDGGGAGSTAYAASKGAVLTMTRGMAKELGPNIRVNALNPGMIDTDFHNIHTKPEARKAYEAAVPVKRQGLPEDVANLVAFLASDESAFMTGVGVDINGGSLFS
ncbi:SDR family NAD(P)-dependent oxidoreductase [Aliiruegeria sabulilitoris]|uniref:SDR family NAD(P)-dependent oxidoreductase n=1 Tax=Aliiruegeria sabulilitoris TaxID=1510458 RepID=UPI000832E2EA|nr:glucose 1-dehydrogenase [Aliiruegeria sabulilitoris]NDR54832.1 glucose 1-dehydrogenase [Pseudoruegeria sp. M32A2M]